MCQIAPLAKAQQPEGPEPWRSHGHGLEVRNLTGRSLKLQQDWDWFFVSRCSRDKTWQIKLAFLGGTSWWMTMVEDGMVFRGRGTVPKCAKSPDLSRLEADPAKSIQNLLRLYHHPQPQPCFIFFHFTLDDSPILFWNHIIYGATGRSERLVSSRLPSCCFASLFWWPNLANHILHGLHSHISYSISPFVEMFSQQNHHLFCIAAWHTSTGANFFIVSWTKSMAGSHLPYLALALGTCSKWPCVFFLLELAASLVTFLLQYQVVLYIYIYIHIYIYIYICICTMLDEQIEYEKLLGHR